MVIMSTITFCYYQYFFMSFLQFPFQHDINFTGSILNPCCLCLCSPLSATLCTYVMSLHYEYSACLPLSCHSVLSLSAPVFFYQPVILSVFLSVFLSVLLVCLPVSFCLPNLFVIIVNLSVCPPVLPIGLIYLYVLVLVSAPACSSVSLSVCPICPNSLS